MKALKDLWEIFVEVMGFGVKQANEFNKVVSKSEANNSARESFEKIVKDTLFIPDEPTIPIPGVTPAALDSPDATIDWNNADVILQWDDNVENLEIKEAKSWLKKGSPIYLKDKDESHYKGKVYRP